MGDNGNKHKDLEKILTKAMNDWVEASFFDSGEDALEDFKTVGKL